MKTTMWATVSCIMLLAACGSGEEAVPTGQVVATVDGDEVTVAELRQETQDLGGAPQDVALRSIIARKELAAYARGLKLETQPETALRQEKAKDLVLVEMLTDKFKKDMPAISKEEAQDYIDSHPSSFVQRRIFLVDQLVILDNSQELIKALQPLETMPEIEAMLRKRNVKYNKTVGAIDSVSIDGDAAEKLASLAPNTVFVLPDGDNMRANAVRDVVIEPLRGDEALKIANETLRTRRAQQTVAKKIEELVKAGESKVRYNPKFEPRIEINQAAPAAPVQAPAK